MTAAKQPDTVYAAGAILWRMDDNEPRVLLIHRNRHDDYSFPKGKVDAGETLPETAVREIEEETGYRVSLGAPLGKIEYELPSGRNKEVHYWTAEVTDTEVERVTFTPNDEVNAQDWVDLDTAAAKLSYARDRELLGDFGERLARRLARTTPILALRHAQAVPPQSWPSVDDSRPLTARGQEQAERVVPMLRAFAPARVMSSTAVRCLATVSPLCQRLGQMPASERALSQSARSEDGTVSTVIDAVVDAGVATVVCSHAPVLPSIVRAVAARCALDPALASTLQQHAMLSTAEFTVLHIARADDGLHLVAVESHGPQI